MKTRNCQKRKYNVDSVVVEENLTLLLSGRVDKKMYLITINYDNFEQVSSVFLPTNVFMPNIS